MIQLGSYVSDVSPEADVVGFFRHLRSSAALHVACDEGDAHTIHRKSFKLIFEIGRHSLPLAVAVSMHMYALAALATYPLPRFHLFNLGRSRLLDWIGRERIVLANTGGARTHSAREVPRVTRVAEGYLLNGKPGLMSLSDVADYAFVEAVEDDGERSAFCVVPLARDRGSIHLTPAFNDTMSISGTCQVHFVDHPVPYDKVIFSGERGWRQAIDVFQRAWNQVLIPAAYLGAAYEALQDAARFATRQRTKNGEPLRCLDGFRAELGRLAAVHEIAMSICDHAATAVMAFDPKSELSTRATAEAAMLAKYHASHSAEEVILALRRYLGLEMVRDHRLSRVMKEIQYGRMHPATDFDIERYFGAKVLAMEE
jgi:alkylation response protein AidB-like acyl-CoA dehydrogenase